MKEVNDSNLISMSSATKPSLCNNSIFITTHDQLVESNLFSYAFTFPKPASTSFKLIEASTVAYIDDSIFYQLDFNTGKAIATMYPPSHTGIRKDAPIKPSQLSINEASPFSQITAKVQTSHLHSKIPTKTLN